MIDVVSNDPAALVRAFDVAEYVDGYEFRGDADYSPNEQECLLLVDAIHGVIAELQDTLRNAQSEEVAVKALLNIRELNMAGADENGHRWANSDLIEQEIVFALTPPAPPLAATECATCNGTGKEALNSICRACDEVPAPPLAVTDEHIERARILEFLLSAEDVWTDHGSGFRIHFSFKAGHSDAVIERVFTQRAALTAALEAKQ